MVPYPPAVAPALSTPPQTLAWYVVHTKPRQEVLALHHLERQGYTCYLPQLQVERVRRRKAVLLREPMFARYLFIQLDSSDAGQSWAPIRSTQGVSQLVRFGNQAAKVDDALLELLRSREHSHAPQTLFHAGDTVCIVEGPFAGLEAIYQITDAERRAMVLLEILSKPVSMRIDAASLSRVEA